jgi:hypothetical protein
MKLRSLAAAAGIAIAATALAGAPAHAAWVPPTSGPNVTYSQCQGPYFAGYGALPIYRCWADYNWVAEWFGGEVDRWEWVRGLSTSYA